MPNKCTIIFNENPSGVYVAGQKLSGKAVLVTSKKQTVKKISIRIEGYSKTHWSEGTGDDSHYYYDQEDYMHSEFQVKASQNGDYFELQPGKYEFSYECQLPIELPGSYRGRHGKIKYKVVCTVERYIITNFVYPQPFIIISRLDLNENPLIRRPINTETNQKFHFVCCFGNKGRMYIGAHIPQGGFIPGEDIPVYVYAKNSTGVKCTASSIRLVEMAEFRDLKVKKNTYVKETLVEHNFGEIKKSAIRELSCPINVPPLPASSLHKSKIIEISYFVEVICKMSGLHHNVSLKMPIIIGTVPLIDVNKDVISTQPTVKPKIDKC